MSRLRLVGALLRGVPYWVRMRSLGSVVPAEIRREVHRSPWVGVTFEASPDNGGGGVPPLRR